MAVQPPRRLYESIVLSAAGGGGVPNPLLSNLLRHHEDGLHGL